MLTLLPLPVEPAMRMWGILAKSATSWSPPLPLPSATASFVFARCFAKSGDSMTPRRLTNSNSSLGTSTPTSGLPGIGASIRMLDAARASARSLSRFAMASTLTRVRETSSRRTTGRPCSSRSCFPSASLTRTSLNRRTQPGSMPNWVTAGPGLISTTLASML